MSSWAVTRWNRALAAERLTGTETRVAIVLATYADGTGGNVRPGVTRLAREVGVAERTVIRALVRLREKGMLLLVSRSDRFRGLADVYRLIIPERFRPSARSHDTGVRPTNYGTTGGRTSPDDPIDRAVAGVPGLGRREAERLASRARGLTRAGMDVGTVTKVLTAPLPDRTGHPAAVLHARLMNVTGMDDGSARGWLDGLVTRWRPARSGPRRTRVVPRTAGDFPGLSSPQLTAW